MRAVRPGLRLPCSQFRTAECVKPYSLPKASCVRIGLSSKRIASTSTSSGTVAGRMDHAPPMIPASAATALCSLIGDAPMSPRPDRTDLGHRLRARTRACRLRQQRSVAALCMSANGRLSGGLSHPAARKPFGHHIGLGCHCSVAYPGSPTSPHPQGRGVSADPDRIASGASWAPFEAASETGEGSSVHRAGQGGSNRPGLIRSVQDHVPARPEPIRCPVGGFLYSLLPSCRRHRPTSPS